MQWRAMSGANIDEDACRQAGGHWNRNTEQCEGIARAQCEQRDGRWDPSTLICHREGKPGTPAPELCTSKGGKWDWEQGLCYDVAGRKVPTDEGTAAATVSSAAPIVIGAALLGAAVWMFRK